MGSKKREVRSKKTGVGSGGFGRRGGGVPEFELGLVVGADDEESAKFAGAAGGQGAREGVAGGFDDEEGAEAAVKEEEGAVGGDDDGVVAAVGVGIAGGEEAVGDAVFPFGDVGGEFGTEELEVVGGFGGIVAHIGKFQAKNAGLQEMQ